MFNKVNLRKAMTITVLMVIFGGPLLTIWSLNLLFGLQIDYSFKSWVAVLWLMVVLHSFKILAKND